jgi:hypothetical protein
MSSVPGAVIAVSYVAPVWIRIAEGTLCGASDAQAVVLERFHARCAAAVISPKIIGSIYIE